MIKIFIDADGCPVKDQIYRVANRYGLKVIVVSNSRIRIPQNDFIELILVNDQLDAADDWIAEKILKNDVLVTADIILASRCLAKGGRVLDPKGRIFSDESIGDALANRELSAYLRMIGEKTGGPAPFNKKDRSRFLQRLDDVIQAAFKATGYKDKRS